MPWIAASTLILCLLVSPGGAQNAPERIEEASFMKIGGIEQWVTMRGDDRRTPNTAALARRAW